MSRERLRRRLERLERMASTSKAERDPMHDQFLIDPVVARAIRDDEWRAYELLQKKTQLSAAEQEESVILQNRIEATAGTIALPAGYGPLQRRRDSNREHHLFCKRISPPP